MSDEFHVDIAELYDVFKEIQSQSKKIISSLEATKSSYNSVITSNSMYGNVGQAIAGEINSSHNMLRKWRAFNQRLVRSQVLLY